MSDPMLIPSLIAYSCEQTGVDGLPETHIQKLLFELCQNLDSDIVSDEFTPYYWFYQGPFSPKLRDLLQSLIELGTLEVFETSNGNILYSAPDSEECIFQEYEYFYEILDQILVYFEPYNISSFIERVYRTRAPYQFISTFKIDVVSQVETHIRENLDKRNLQTLKLEDFKNSSFKLSLIRSLYNAESMVIEEEPILANYNSLFSNYITYTIDNLETTWEEVDNIHNFLLELGKVKDLTFDAWKTFANGIRITNAGHDPEFESDVLRWIPIFENKTDSFANTLRTIEEGIYKKSHKYQYPSEESKKIFSSIINGYLST